jgi:prolipoprotein diacylglyceryltransferase
MQQVIFRIPLRQIFNWMPGWIPDSLPIYGFGLMLCITLFVCLYLTSWRAKKEGIAPQHIQDLALWIFGVGIVGARITFMIQYERYERPITEFFSIWQGGLVFYGSAIGGFIGYILAYYFVLRKYSLSSWKMADIIAPSVAVGLCIGRIGCLLNGCCYGNVAVCHHCPGICFPLSAPSRLDSENGLVAAGLQTAAGFAMTDKESDDVRTVIAVAPGSPAFESGLRPGDRIVAADEHPILNAVYLVVKEGQEAKKYPFRSWGECHDAIEKFKKRHVEILEVYDDLADYLVRHWPRGKKDLVLTVSRGGKEIALPAFTPYTLPLHPTQIYESISMILLFFVLTAYYPLRRHDGEVMILFMIGYAVHRFLNEMLRNDTDPLADGMTLSQNGSILFAVAGLILAWWLWRQPAQYPSAKA